METFDVVVIGAGPGGYPAAIRAAQLGASVAIVEREALGGTCLNWGCIPTKSLIAGSDLLARMRGCGELGLSVKDASFDYAAMVKRKDAVVSKLSGGVEQLLKANGVTVLRGTASFADRNRVTVKGSGKRGKDVLLAAGRTIIATGSDSAVPGFLPRGKNVVDSRAFLAMRKLPASLLVLGGGVIGCEFACLAAQLGVEVTVVEMLDDILMMLDADLRRELRRHMEKELGIRVLTGAALEQVAHTGKGVSGKAGGGKLKAECLLVSVGRLPVTAGLALERAGLRTDERGYIEVDEFGQTSAATVYAIGDVTAGSTQLAHAATSQGVVAAENACGNRARAFESLVPACIFTAPEIGSVGLTEQAAAEQGLDVRCGKFAFGALGKGMACGHTEGFVKWVADARTDRLLGAHAVGEHATELISEAALAIRSELTAAELGRTIHCHPTFSEAWMEAAHAVHGVCLHAPPKRRR